MKTVNLITVSILTSAVSLTAFANPPEQTQSSGDTEESTSIPMPEGMTPMMHDQQGGMPMMQGQQGGMPMMRGQQGGMPMMRGQQGGMPMMRGEQGGMPMMRGQQGGMPMMRGQQGGMPMMRGQQGGMHMMRGQQGGMPMMQMMHQRQGEMLAHRKKMESHLERIEALLSELVELAKSK